MTSRKTSLLSIPKALSVTLLLLSMLFGVFRFSVSSEAAEIKYADDVMEQLGLSAEEYRVVQLTNRQRMDAGLNPLIISPSMQNTANIRAEELARKFSHTRPDNTSCFTAYTAEDLMGYSGENIAAYYTSADSVVLDGWMKSQGHKDNILTSGYKYMGAGYEPNSNSWVQNFCGHSANVASIKLITAKSVPIRTKADDLGFFIECLDESGKSLGYIPLMKEFIYGYDRTSYKAQTVYCNALGLSVTAKISVCYIGDVDNDGEITAADARLALRAAVGIKNDTDVSGNKLNLSSTSSRDFNAANADNSDSLITASDARLILRMAVGLE